MSTYLSMIDQAIETEVQMEIMRQKLKQRKDFDTGKAFLTMTAGTRNELESA